MYVSTVFKKSIVYAIYMIEISTLIDNDRHMYTYIRGCTHSMREKNVNPNYTLISIKIILPVWKNPITHTPKLHTSKRLLSMWSIQWYPELEMGNWQFYIYKNNKETT